VIRLQPAPSLDGPARAAVLDIARAAFQMRRKTLRHGITHAAAGDERRGMAWLDAAAIDSGRRPGTLDLDEWHRIALAASTLAEQP
jgi:16S rRNA A1518/A1519 N6-dimethyltransferase RsmA/KsgA/DIM1 with predicted DNA glycosylase/AP lyase activity